MLGVILQTFAGLFEEISLSIGKKEVQKHHETIFLMGFFQHSAALLMFITIILLGFEKFVFNLASLPTFIPRIFLEILQVHFTLLALRASQRTTFGFIKSLTIPLLLTVDLILGYQIQPVQILAMVLMIGIFFFIFFEGVVNKRGLGYVLFSAINPVLTISLYKYNITNFNSVGAEQGVIYSIIVLYLYIYIKIKTREIPWHHFRRKEAKIQAISEGLGSLINSFAYLFAPASVIVTARRCSSVLWSTLSGLTFFHEKHSKLKTATAFILIAILLLLAMK